MATTPGPVHCASLLSAVLLSVCGAATAAHSARHAVVTLTRYDEFCCCAAAAAAVAAFVVSAAFAAAAPHTRAD
ncbi:hypothetical protein E2C01_016805 [Portunus trituberculatus]|uniref:Uncharacterized protein n=1 Tax=Portunus trituberculatus TaxID=210409 RepID=A0A5B7DR87_PORTR|nr:hypothetical protein [Portunus trituberculatus]